MYYKRFFISIFLFSFFASAKSILITECDDISLMKSAYANNKGHLAWENPVKDTLVMNSWRCWGVEQVTSEGRVALKFDLTSIPNDVEITNATFSIYRLGDYLGYDMLATTYISPINKSWSGSTASWDNLALSCDAPVTESTLPSNTTGWLEFDVTSLIKDMIRSRSNNGFMLSCTTNNTSNSNGQFSFLVSSESPDTEKVPKLEIEYTGGTAISNDKSNNLIPLTFYLSKNKLNIIAAVNLEKSSIEFINTAGKAVCKIKKDITIGTNSINVPKHISKGTYLLLIKNSKIRILKKLMIN